MTQVDYTNIKSEINRLQTEGLCQPGHTFVAFSKSVLDISA